MKQGIITIYFLASLLCSNRGNAQRRLDAGTVVKIIGVGVFDSNYPIREKLINKTGIVANNILVNMGGAKDGIYNPLGPYGGDVTIEGKLYSFLDVTVEVVKGNEASPTVKKTLTLSEDIKAIVKAYFLDFKEYVDKSNYEDNSIKSFDSKFKLAGSYGRNTIYHFKSSNTWSFNASVDISKISLADLKQTLENISFDFGTLKILNQGSNKDWTYYIPKTKNGTDMKLKELTISLFVETESFVRFTVERTPSNASK